MENLCTLCGEYSDGTVSIYSSYRGVQITKLIHDYTRLRADELSTQSCCYDCLVLLSKCNNLRNTAEGLNLNSFESFQRDLNDDDDGLASSISITPIYFNNCSSDESRYESDAERIKKPKNSNCKKPPPAERPSEHIINASSSTVFDFQYFERRDDPQPRTFQKRSQYISTSNSDGDSDNLYLPGGQRYSSRRYGVNVCRGYEHYINHFDESFVPSSSSGESDVDSEILFGIGLGN